VTANNVDALFGVDVFGAKRYAAVLRRWAAGDGGGIKLV
jgi:hypothetical protein